MTSNFQSTPLWQAEFPDYPVDAMPAIPASWVDTSWHNDGNPSFYAGGEHLVFVDYPDPEDREMPDYTRFTIHRCGPGGARLPITSGWTFLMDTDDWDAVLAFVAEERAPA